MQLAQACELLGLQEKSPLQTIVKNHEESVILPFSQADNLVRHIRMDALRRDAS